MVHVVWTFIAILNDASISRALKILMREIAKTKFAVAANAITAPTAIPTSVPSTSALLTVQSLEKSARVANAEKIVTAIRIVASITRAQTQAYRPRPRPRPRPVTPTKSDKAVDADKMINAFPDIAILAFA